MNLLLELQNENPTLGEILSATERTLQRVQLLKSRGVMLQTNFYVTPLLLSQMQAQLFSSAELLTEALLACKYWTETSASKNIHTRLMTLKPTSDGYLLCILLTSFSLHIEELLEILYSSD